MPDLVSEKGLKKLLTSLDRVQDILDRVFLEVVVESRRFLVQQPLGLEGRPRGAVVGVSRKRLEDAERDLVVVGRVLGAGSRLGQLRNDALKDGEDKPTQSVNDRCIS